MGGGGNARRPLLSETLFGIDRAGSSSASNRAMRGVLSSSLQRIRQGSPDGLPTGVSFDDLPSGGEVGIGPGTHAAGR